jgi:ornithine cyclodeaminase
MLILDAEQVRRTLDWHPLIEALRAMFERGCEVPLRHHHAIAAPGGDATLLLMPAWTSDVLGVKIVSVFPGNATHGLPAVCGSYILNSGQTGEPLAIIDGGELTARRTAAASALAATFLARPDASRLLVVGTGRLAPYLAMAHATVRPISSIAIWGRRPERATEVAARLQAEGLAAEVATDLATAVARADVVSCATLSATPLVEGHWLREGTHVDLVGGFTPQMREADDEAVRRALVFVDTRQGACAEAGDIVAPIRSGVLAPHDIRADLFDLCRGQHPGRQSASQITLFKSVGTALEDLAAAALAYERARP